MGASYFAARSALSKTDASLSTLQSSALKRRMTSLPTVNRHNLDDAASDR
jgi:hypothetical protein